MNIQGYQKLTLLDYPGKTACTVFTGGCNFKCPFCHNSPLVNSPVMYNSLEQEVLQYLEKRKGLLDGVCITGGEPLLQKDIEDFILKLKGMGYSVKLDTNGALWERLKGILDKGLVDYVAMDIKSSLDTYNVASGCRVDTESIEKSVQEIVKSGVEYEFRTTVVKGLHDERILLSIAQWLGDKRYFLQSYTDSGAILSGEGLGSFSPDELKQMLDKIKIYVPGASLRGVD